MLKNNKSKASLKEDKKFAIVSEIMMSISNRRELHLDFTTIANIDDMCNIEFSHSNSKDLMFYLKTAMLTHQHLFWKRNTESSHYASTKNTSVLLSELFTHYNGGNSLQSLIPYFQQINRFDGTTKSNSPDTWMHWIINKTLLCLMHSNSVKPNLIICAVSRDLLTLSAVAECKNQILKFF